jgi:predicted amidohydrolase
MSKLKITVIQTDIVWENPAENLKHYNKLILSQPGSDLYVLPEMLNTGFTDNTKDFAETSDGFTLESLREISRISGAAICGSLILTENDKNYNAFVFVRPDGSVTKYFKRHLFKYGGEAEMFSRGEERVVVDYLGFKILLQICYDLRFPVWSRNSDNYDAIIYVANWPASRRNIFDVLIKARAIENLAYVIACNRTGEDGKNIKYDGGSCIIDFKGEMLSYAGDNSDAVISVELDKDALKSFRKSFPALDDRDSFELKF